MKISRNSKGFTLIELLIVVAIIGILAAIAIPAYSGYTKKAKAGGIVHTMGAIKNALVAYYVESGVGPSSNLTATSTPSIKSALGIDVVEQYATFAVAQNTGAITATALNTLDLGGANKTITLTPDAQFKLWTWGGDAESSYIPKG
jgi:type IV pilus assembly protein PilA